MTTRYTPRKTWAALYSMRCDEAGILREQIKPRLRPNIITNMRLWKLWGMWLGEVDRKQKKSDIVVAPFTEDQVNSINSYQSSGVGHPFTCPHCRNNLIAYAHGLNCCGCGKWFTTWVHGFMANWEWNYI